MHLQPSPLPALALNLTARTACPTQTRHWSHADHLYSRHHQQQQRWPAEGGAQPVNAAALGAAANGAARGALPVGGTPSQGAIIYGAVGQQDLAFADWFAT